MTEYKPRYTLAHIVTSDITVCEQNSLVNKTYGYTQEQIYRAGLDALEKLHKQNEKLPG